MRILLGAFRNNNKKRTLRFYGHEHIGKLAILRFCANSAEKLRFRRACRYRERTLRNRFLRPLHAVQKNVCQDSDKARDCHELSEIALPVYFCRCIRAYKRIRHGRRPFVYRIARHSRRKSGTVDCDDFLIARCSNADFGACDAHRQRPSISVQAFRAVSLFLCSQ